MRTLSFVLVLLALLCPALGSAQPVDPFRVAQSVTTAVGKGEDSTKVSAGKGNRTWSTRSFTAQTTKVCRSSKPSFVGLASTGAGTADLVLMNAQGKVSITWDFLKGASLSSVEQIEFDVVAGKESASALSDLFFTATLQTGSSQVTVTRTEYNGSTRLPSTERTLSFNFKDAAPALFGASDTVRSLTVEVESRSVCEVNIGLQSVRSLSSSRAKARSAGRVGKAEAAPDDEAVPVEAGTPVATPTPQVNPCDEDPSVPDQIRWCEERLNFQASGCQEWKCTCKPNYKKNTYRIFSTSSWSGDGSVGASCKNNMCGGAPGRCSDFGECIPAQFYDWKHSHIGVSADGVVFSGFDNQVDSDCFDLKKFPTTRQLCSMTPDEVERAVSGSIVVGKQCDLSENSKGVCDQQGKCVPDPSADYYCRDKGECTACGDGTKMCWLGKCLTYEEAEVKVCKDSGRQNVGRGICQQCYVLFTPNKDGTCGIGVWANDARGVIMDGAACTRTVNGITSAGTCRGGECVLRQATPTPVGTAGK